MELPDLVSDIADGIKLADSRRPQAINVRSKKPYKPGIGPHSESQTVQLLVNELKDLNPTRYRNRLVTDVPYPTNPRLKCDLCIGYDPSWEWAVEVKMLRLLGDNGKVNDNMLMHILSPYPKHRSALTDCAKLNNSGFPARKAIVIYGYEDTDWPLRPAIDAFVSLAQSEVTILAAASAGFEHLIHPVHSRGCVYGWEIQSTDYPS